MQIFVATSPFILVRDNRCEESKVPPAAKMRL